MFLISLASSQSRHWTLIDRHGFSAIENLTLEPKSVEKLDAYDKVEIFCLQAALTPCQYFRQKNLGYIEKYATNDVLGHEVAAKLLALSQDLSDPQSKIDLLLTVFNRYGDPEMMERAIPILYSAVKERDPSQSDSNEDILNFSGRSPGKIGASALRSGCT